MHVLQSAAELHDGQTFDAVVVGAGGAGLASALFLAMGQAHDSKPAPRVLLIESTEYVGGTTALSAGTAWIPLSPHAAQANPNDTVEAVLHYLRGAQEAEGEQPYDMLRPLQEAFVAQGGATVAQLAAHSAIHFRPYAKHPDYLSELEGATLCGRALEPLPFDGRKLGKLFALLRPPIAEFTVLDGMMVDRTDIHHLLSFTQSWPGFCKSLPHVLKILSRHALDRLSRPRGTRLVMGNALVGRLLYSLSKFPHVTLALRTSVSDLSELGAGCLQVCTQTGSQTTTRRLHSTGGVVLASGGFNRNPALRSQLLNMRQTDWCPAAPGHTGDALHLALTQGASLGANPVQPNARHAFWAPVSLRTRPDGSSAVFPHFVMDRAKPGMITVNARAQRFVNESCSYHQFALAMQADKAAVPAYLLADARALKAYGMGMVRPYASAKSIACFVAQGYLVCGQSWADLAGQLGLNAAVLAQTVQRFNQMADAGHDEDFRRGQTAYAHNIGDPAWTGLNPNLGALTQAPFYAVKLYPGDIGAATGLQTNANAQVLNAHQTPLKGLYAVGNDMHSIMGGVYTAPGITIGPGLVFAYIASQHLLANCEALNSNPNTSDASHAKRTLAP